MSRYIAFALAASVLALPASAAERKFDPDACAKAVAPYLDDQTFAVLHVDLTAVDVDALAAKAAGLRKVDADALPFPRRQLAADGQVATDAGARDLYVVVSLADVPERPPFVVMPLEKRREPKAGRDAQRAGLGPPLLRACGSRITTRRSAPRWWAAATRRSSACTT